MSEHRLPYSALPRLAMPLRYWLFVVLTLALAAAVGVVAFRTAQLLQRWQPDRNLLLLPGENIVRLLLIAICIGLGLLSGLPLTVLGWTLAQWPEALLKGLLWGIAMAAGFYAATQWIVARSDEQYYSRVVLDAILPRNRREMLWSAAAMLGVVIAEELLFRSLLLGGLQPILPTTALLAITGIAFGALHLPQGRWGIAGAAIAGVLLGLIFLASGTLVAPIAAHYVTNMVQIAQAVRMNRTQRELNS